MKLASKLLLPVAACVLLGAVASASASEKSTWVVEGGVHLVSDADDRCLGVESVTPGKALSILTCNGSAGQIFEHVGDRITVGELCLDAVDTGGINVMAANCAVSPTQSWVRDSQRALRVAGKPVCISSLGGNGPIKLEECYDVPGQRWRAMTP